MRGDGDIRLDDAVDGVADRIELREQLDRPRARLAGLDPAYRLGRAFPHGGGRNRR